MNDKINILIADDHMVVRRLILAILRRKPYVNEIYEAKSGKDAVEILKTKKVDMLLCDNVMPDGDGMHVLEFLKEEKIVIPTLMFSNNNDSKTELLEYGANDFLHKPITDVALLSKIEQFLDI